MQFVSLPAATFFKLGCQNTKFLNPCLAMQAKGLYLNQPLHRNSPATKVQVLDFF